MGEIPNGEFERFFEIARPALLRQAYVYTGDLEESKDLVQETLARAWRDWRKVSRLEDPQAWARRVLNNLAIGGWRRRRSARRHARPGREALPTVSQAAVEHADLVTALASLRDRERQVLVLHAVVGLSIPEIAGELGASEGTARVWLSRARAAVAASMAESPRAPSARRDRRG